MDFPRSQISVSVNTNSIARKQTFATAKYRKYAPLTWLSSRAMSL